MNRLFNANFYPCGCSTVVVERIGYMKVHPIIFWGIKAFEGAVLQVVAHVLVLDLFKY